MAGSEADLVIVDLNLEQIVTSQLIQGFCAYSIFVCWKGKGSLVLPIFRG